MIKKLPQYQLINIDKLKKADFYFKSEISKDAVEAKLKTIKFQKAIELGGYGIITVRTIPNSEDFEVLDGWKRIELMKQGNCKFCHVEDSVMCQNFGSISTCFAVKIARIKNHQWSNLSLIEFSKCLKANFKEEELNKLTNLFPESKQELHDLYILLDFDWSQFDCEKLKG